MKRLFHFFKTTVLYWICSSRVSLLDNSNTKEKKNAVGSEFRENDVCNPFCRTSSSSDNYSSYSYSDIDAESRLLYSYDV